MKPEIIAQAQKLKKDADKMLELVLADSDDKPDAATRGDTRKPPPVEPPGRP